ncbi:MAG: N(4)-(beta-N-acetylglucosaminyl)-L-asparaginase [Gemmataceae bacterium]
MPDYIVIATWTFGQTAVKAAAPLLEADKSAMDAVVAGAQAVEDDPTVTSVGYGGMPNAIGTVQLDACVMDGHTLDCGSVGAVENIRHVAALARHVIKTPHIYLVGAGAQQFALKHGFPLENLNTASSMAKWEKNKPAPAKRPPDSHDTVNVLALDKKGSLAGACSTSGLAYKLNGRVGDSPLIGAGLYVDNTAGAAGGTGHGEEIIRIGGSLLIVEAMRAGKSAQEACELAIRKVNAVAVRRGIHPHQVAFLALDPKGNHGAAATERSGFEYAVARPGHVELLKAKEIGVEAK